MSATAMAQKLFDAADVIEDFARDYLSRAKRDLDAGDIQPSEYQGMRDSYRIIVRGAARIEDLGHGVIERSLASKIENLQAAVNDLKSTNERLARAKRVVTGAASFVTLAASLVALAALPSPTTGAALAAAILDFAATIRKLDSEDD